MTDAQRAIIALLRSLFDFLPEPETWTGRVQRRQLVERGVAATEKAKCPHCQGRGKLGARQCDRCDGRGWLAVDPMTYSDPGVMNIECPECKGGPDRVACQRCEGRGRIVSDIPGRKGKPQPREAVGSEETGALRAMTAREYDAALRRLAEGTATDPAEYVLARFEVRDRIGSYRELERALADLSKAAPYHYRLILDVYVFPPMNGRHPMIGDEHPAQLARGILFLEKRVQQLTGGRIRVPPWLTEPEQAKARKSFLWYGKTAVAEQARRERDREIVRLRDVEGMPIDEISRRIALQKSVIYEVLAREAAYRVATGPAT